MEALVAPLRFLYNSEIQTTFSPKLFDPPARPIHYIYYSKIKSSMSTSDEVLEIPILTHDSSLPPSYYIYNTLCEHNLYLLLIARMLPTDGPPTALALRLANDDLILNALRSETTTIHVSPPELILSNR